MELLQEERSFRNIWREIWFFLDQLCKFTLLISNSMNSQIALSILSKIFFLQNILTSEFFMFIAMVTIIGTLPL